MLHPLRCAAVERMYYIAAEEVDWDYAPTGQDGFTGRMLNESMEQNQDSAMPTAAGSSGTGGMAMSLSSVMESPSFWISPAANR